MITVKIEFEKRVSEVEEYFKLLDNFFEKDAILYFPNKQTHKYKRLNPELEKVLKANSFLLLYNVIEASIKQSLTEIYDQITSKGVTYNQVTSHFKQLWIKENYKNFKDQGEKNIFQFISGIENDVIEIEFDANKIISGNIDRRKIEYFSQAYGFSTQVHYSAGNGDKLHQVKVRRNNLAHGNISFSECGREFTYEDLCEIKKQVIRYMRQILNNIDKFLNEEKFLD